MKKFPARVLGVYTNPILKTQFSAPVDKIEVNLEGFKGDYYSGLTSITGKNNPDYPRGTEIRNRRQITAVSIEELKEIADRLGLPYLQPDWFSANLLLEGIPDLSLIPPLSRIFFPQETVLVIDEENPPCSGLAKLIQAQFPDIAGIDRSFVKQAMHLRGVTAWVERPGWINAGDSVLVEIHKQNDYPVEEK